MWYCQPCFLPLVTLVLAVTLRIGRYLSYLYSVECTDSMSILGSYLRIQTRYVVGVVLRLYRNETAYGSSQYLERDLSCRLVQSELIAS
jgi:hypothetical protein